MSDNMFDREALKKMIQEASPKYKKRKKLNQFLSNGIGLLGILLSLGATISGILNKENATWSAIFGACAATTQAILFAYPVDKRSRVYSLLLARNENLRTELEVRQQTDEELQKILEEFKSIRVEAAREEAVLKKPEEAQEPSPDSPIEPNSHSRPVEAVG